MDESRPIDLADEESASFWQQKFGVTATQLEEAVKAAGTDPGAIREHLMDYGASAGAS